MTTTYAVLTKQIAALEARADKARKSEVAGVIDRINKAITAYGIRPEDLRFSGANSTVAKVPFALGPGAKKTAPTAKYGDDAGNVWVGRGPRPLWLRSALDAGKPLSSFLIGSSSSTSSANSSAVTPAVAKKTTKAAAAPAPKYRDSDGRAWSGRGPKPGWLKDALATGKVLADFQA